MLTQLTIKNFGLINDLTIEFTKGLNILTGETGAGKSILIEAIRYLLGERISSSQIRDIKNSCIVEGVFELSKNLIDNPIIKEFLAGDDSELIINRNYSADGKNKIKINGLNITISQLKILGDNLVDIHGAYDHQKLLSPQEHIKILDRLSEVEELKNNFYKLYCQYSDLNNQLNELIQTAKSQSQELETLDYQIKELETVPLDLDKHNQFFNDQKRLQNGERIYENGNAIINALEDNDTGIKSILKQIWLALKNLNQLDESTIKYSQIFTNITDQINDLSGQLNSYVDSSAFNPQEANNINATCDIYNTLKRKYGQTIEEVINYYQKIKQRYELLVNIENSDKKIRRDMANLEVELKKLGDKLSKQRKTKAVSLKNTIEEELSQLGMPAVKFICQITSQELNAQGYDNVAFYFSSNLGEDLKPLAQIASSGEAARVMLALKKALIKVDTIPTLIFDEIDAQIGGRLGTITGKKLKELSLNRQVILITHLPQIAAFADSHFKVFKKVENKRTNTFVELLNNKARTQELANMMSGQEKSEISLKHACELISKAERN